MEVFGFCQSFFVWKNSSAWQLVNFVSAFLQKSNCSFSFASSKVFNSLLRMGTSKISSTSFFAYWGQKYLLSGSSITSTSKSIYSCVTTCCQYDLQQLSASITSENEESSCEMLLKSPFSREICPSKFENEFISSFIIFNDCSASDVTWGLVSTLRQWTANFVISPRFSKHIHLPRWRWQKWINNFFFVHFFSFSKFIFNTWYEHICKVILLLVLVVSSWFIFSVIWKILFKYSFKDSLLNANKNAWIIAVL